MRSAESHAAEYTSNLCRRSLRDNDSVPPRWNAWAGIQTVQFDWEKEPKERQVRLSAPTARVGDPVRVRMSGAEIEGIITDASTPVLKVKVKATALKVNAKSKRSRSA